MKNHAETIVRRSVPIGHENLERSKFQKVNAV